MQPAERNATDLPGDLRRRAGAVAHIGGHSMATITIHALAAADPEAAYRRAGFTGDLKRSGRNLVGLCPLHADTDASFAIGLEGEHAGRWQCFGACQTGGDLIDFYRSLHGVEFGVARDELGRLFGLDGPPGDRPRIPPPRPEPPPRTEPPPISPAVVEACHRTLLAHTATLAWLTEHKGLPRWVIDTAMIGAAHRTWIADGPAEWRYTIPVPYMDGREGFRDIRAYRPGDRNKMLPWGRGHGVPTVYPWPWVAGHTELLWVEGEIDGLNLIGRGVPAMTCTCGAGSALRVVLPQLSGKRIRILVDNDDAGEKTRHELPERLFAAGADRVSVLTWPEGMPKGYDVSDWFAAGGDVGGLGL